MGIRVILFYTLVTGVAAAKDIAPEDCGASASLAIKALKAATAAQLTELTVTRAPKSVDVQMIAGDVEKTFLCQWEENLPKPELRCAVRGRDVDPRPKEAPPTASWDSRQKVLSAEDCGTAAANAVKALKVWDEAAHQALQRYTVERTKYSASVKLVYLESSKERTKSFLCHWHAHGKETALDCH